MNKIQAAQPHTCHAMGCDLHVDPRMFMCRRHWFSLPSEMRDTLWANYRRGQEVDKQPSAGYMEIAKLCIEWLAKKEGLIS